MAKKNKNESEEPQEGDFFNAHQGNNVKVVDPSHLKPQVETDGPPQRPKAVDPKHLKPQE